MKTYRKNAAAAGVLFVFGFAGMFAPLVRPLLDSPDCLNRLAEYKNQVMISAFLLLVMALACAGIAVALYPVLRKRNESLALGAVGFRIIENVFQGMAALCLLAMLTLSQNYAGAGSPSVSAYQALSALLLNVRFWSGQVLAGLCFCLGALMYYCSFYQSKLIPRWLSGWGIMAILMHLVFVLISAFGQIDVSVMTPLILLSAPIFFQELVLAGWLILKGFDPSVTAALCAQEDI